MNYLNEIAIFQGKEYTVIAFDYERITLKCDNQIKELYLKIAFEHKALSFVNMDLNNDYQAYINKLNEKESSEKETKEAINKEALNKLADYYKRKKENLANINYRSKQFRIFFGEKLKYKPYELAKRK